MRSRLCLVLLLASGCTTAAPALDAATTADAAPADVTATDAVTDAAPAVDRGPTRIVIDGDPNGLWWDPAASTLFLADNDNNRILAWRDGQPVSLVAALPPGPPNGPGLGQLVRLADGTLVVTRFGDGTAGDVVYVTRDGTVGRLSSLDATRRRIGLTVADDGTLYDGWFLLQSSGRVGSVSSLTLAGQEPPVLLGLSKPVGVLAVGSRLFVSDQARNEVLVADRAMPSSMQRFAMVMGPDLLCAGPAGSLFAGSLTGVVFRIAADGSVSTFDSGYSSTRGVAYDAVNRRLFVAEHDTDPTDGVMNVLHVVPVDL